MFKKTNDVHLNNYLIIKLVSQYPEIWDKNSDLYRDRQRNDIAWKCILRKLFNDWEDCSDEIKSLLEQMVVRRWCNIRDSYAKSYKKYKQHQQTGGRTPSKYIYYKHLAFLEPLVSTDPSEPSVNKEKTETIKSEVVAESEEQITDDFPSYEVPIDVDDSQILGTMSPTVSNEHNPLNFEDSYRTDDSNTISKYIDLLHHMSGKMTDRHDMFFQGLLPSLKDFTEDETLELQINVIQCINNIKEQRNNK